MQFARCVPRLRPALLPRRQASLAEANRSCIELVRKADREHFLTTLMLPKAAQPAVFALRALNIELASISDNAQQKHARDMRFVFWRDALGRAPTEAPKHPVAVAIAAAKKQHNLTAGFLNRLIRAREIHVDDPPFDTLEEADRYGEDVNASILYLTLEALNIRMTETDHSASHVGRAEGLVTLLRGVPYLASRKKVRLPIDLCIKHNVSQQQIIRGESTAGLQDLVHEIASSAVRHLNTVRAHQASLPKDARVVMLPAVAATIYLDQLLASDFNIFKMRPDFKTGLLPVLLAWHNWRGTC